MQFSPGIYEHAASLIGRRPWCVSRDSELLATAHITAWRRYRHPLVVAGIDVYNLEAEAYGAIISEPKGNNIPSISTHPCSEVVDILALPPLDPDSHVRIRGVLKAGRQIQAECPQALVYVPVCGPFSLAIGLLGMNELLMALVEDRAELVDALTHLLTGQRRYLKAIHDAGLRPMLFESGTTPPLLPVEAFETVEAPLLKELFAYAKELFGESPACIIGGDATPIVRPLLEAGPGYVIAPSETNQAAFIDRTRDFPDVHVRVNFPATVLLEKTYSRITDAADRALELAHHRVNTSVGCGVVPFETNPEILTRLGAYIASC